MAASNIGNTYSKSLFTTADLSLISSFLMSTYLERAMDSSLLYPAIVFSYTISFNFSVASLSFLSNSIFLPLKVAYISITYYSVSFNLSKPILKCLY